MTGIRDWATGQESPLAARNAVLLEGGTCDAYGNKGDELMLHAVLQGLEPHRGVLDLVGLLQSGGFLERSRLGLRQLLWERRLSRLSGWIGYPILRRYGKPFGIVADEELHAVLNFMGYRYADFGARETAADARRHEARRRRGTRTIFLPQAYGPFDNFAVRKTACSLFDGARLVFARDIRSAEALKEIGVRSPVLVSPDITIPLSGSAPDYPLPRDFLVLIPNLWMLERVPQDVALAYVDFLVTAGSWALGAGLAVIVMSHSDFQDASIAQDVLLRLQHAGDVRVVVERDAFKAKGLIGRARIVVGSRYHSLVAGLSQNVATFGTSWAHKYKGLFDDYECPENLIDPTIGNREFLRRLDAALRPASQAEITEHLQECNRRLCAQVAEMWTRVYAEIVLNGTKLDHGR